MRFCVQVDQDWNVTIACPQQDPTWQHTHVMRKLAPDKLGRVFPVPLAGQAPNKADLLYQNNVPDQDKAREIADIYRRINARDANEGDIERYGRYLFASLLGQAAWTAIKKRVMAEPLIELALTWTADEWNLHRLNWELMHDGQGFLVTEVPHKMVVISRVVAGKQQQAAPLDVPPRVLYVLGTTVADPEIRPGAEFLGLLRTLEGPGLSLNYRLLENATQSRIQKATEEFLPDVVHFICHGSVDPTDNRGYLELHTDQAGEDKNHKGDQLLRCLKTATGVLVPKLVVLSACYSATPGLVVQGPYLAAPLAAELVAGGVPVVLGMGGRISDLACRLFTSGFGEAVLHGKSLVRAAGQARVIAFAHGMPPRQKADWAFPIMFMAECVHEDYVPIPPGAANPKATIHQWVKEFKVREDPVFCGRDKFFQAYYELFEKGHPSVLVASVTGAAVKLGKTRFLKELTIRALHDGQVPCLLRPDCIPGWQPPKDALDLAREIMKTIDEARGVLKLEPSTSDQVLGLMNLGRSFDQGTLHSSNLDRRIKQALRLGTSMTPQAVRIALEIELRALVNEARQTHEIIRQGHGHAIVLLDDVDKYGDAIDDLGTMLNEFGLGAADEPVPVVMAFSKTGPAGIKLAPITGQNWPWLAERPLEAFSDKNEEDLLAYKWILLNPFKSGEIRHVIGDLADPPLFLILLRDTFDRTPGALADKDKFYAFTKKIDSWLIPADDEAYMTQWRQANPTMFI